MTQVDCFVTSLRPRRLAARGATVDSPGEVEPVMTQLFDRVAEAISETDAPLQHPVAVYLVGEDDAPISFLAGYDYSGDDGYGFAITEIPAYDHAVCTVHIGATSGIPAAWKSLREQMAQLGLKAAGPPRELYMRAFPRHDQSGWVTQLQQPAVPL